VDVLGQTDNLSPHIVEFKAIAVGTRGEYQYPDSAGFPSFRIPNVTLNDTVRILFSSEEDYNHLVNSIVRVNVLGK